MFLLVASLDIQHLGFLVAGFHSLTKAGRIILNAFKGLHVILCNTPSVNATRHYHESFWLGRRYHGQYNSNNQSITCYNATSADFEASGLLTSHRTSPGLCP